MKTTKFLTKTARLLIAAVLLLALSLPATAQRNKYKDYREVYRDTVDYVAPTELDVQVDTIFDPMSVVVNRFGKNWFVFATGGAHTFRGDYSNIGNFWGTVSPDWGVGIGKWITPGMGIKAEFIRSNSRGYTTWISGGHYGEGDIFQLEDGTPYRLMKTMWWDASVSLIFNISRLVRGYEGQNSPRMMNQFMGSVGIGAVHHMGHGEGHGSDNEFSAHIELQYSRFFSRAKRFSLDVKARALMYQTNFDLEYGQSANAAYKWDSNLGLDLGFTFYLDRAREGGWQRASKTVYMRDYRQRDIMVVRERETETPVDYGTLTFFVYFPNNYSGRNDAPNIPGATVNAVDYLAGGIFTQKQYASTADVDARNATRSSLKGLRVVDLPTEKANQDFEIDFVPRGYELEYEPMSLSLKAKDMQEFRDKAGFYYSAIDDGRNIWQYRIDDATLGQQLVSGANYQETESFGLNAHRGLDLVREYMDVNSTDELVSFADMYAAMTSNEGFISQYADSTTVARIRDILENGSITMIQAEGLATSQDNYTGANAEQIGWDRNTALSRNRADTIINWLKSNETFNEVSSQIYLVNSLSGPVRTVTDKSTRGINAKINRCVRIRIQFMMK